MGAVKRRFWEKGDWFDGLGFVGWASITGGGVGGALSTASACGATEEKSKAAIVA